MTETSEQFRERKLREIKPVTLRGFLGWGNRKGGYEAYGPGGRWDNVDPDGTVRPRTNPDGDLLGDALERAGAHEGATLLVIAVDRFGDTSVLDQIESLLAGAAGPQATPDPPTLAELIRTGRAVVDYDPTHYAVVLDPADPYVKYVYGDYEAEGPRPPHGYRIVAVEPEVLDAAREGR